MEHIEEAGVHSGDSACAIPPYSLPGPVLAEIREAARRLAMMMNVRGLMNIQFAIKREEGKQTVYVLEVNPRASRTVPFVAKATGRPLAKIAARVMAGEKLEALGVTEEKLPTMVSVKEAVLPFRKFPGIDVVLGPEMKSTGETMGSGETFPEAYAKALLGAGVRLPLSGRAVLRVDPADAQALVPLAEDLRELGFEVAAGEITAQALEQGGQHVELGEPNERLDGTALVLAAGKDRSISAIFTN